MNNNSMQNQTDIMFHSVKEPTYHTSNKVIYTKHNTELRKFNPTNKDSPIVLIIAPCSGNHSCIIDYDKQKSVVERFINQGFNVYGITWQSATYDHKDLIIEDYIKATNEAVKIIQLETKIKAKDNKKIHLVGFSQGGWQAVIYASLNPKQIKTLTIVSAPVDCYSDAKDDSDMSRAKNMPDWFYDGMVASSCGLVDGKFMLMGYKNMNFFESYIGKYYKLYKDMFNTKDNDKDIEKYKKFEQYVNYTQKISGAFYSEIVNRIFKNNDLVKGNMEFYGSKIDLAKINCPVFILVGSKDEIVPKYYSTNIIKYISTHKKDIHVYEDDCSHLGIMMSKRVLDNTWQEVIDKLFNYHLGRRGEN